MSVCVLLVQGATLMKKVGKLTEEGIIQQSSIYVHPLECLQHKKHQHLTENDKLENRCTLVTNVGIVIHLTATYMPIWIFIQVSTSAQNVADVVRAAMHWQYTGEVIQERNRLNVLFVANDLQQQVALLYTAEFTVETNHTSVTCVARRFVSLYL